jgi:glycosyltransferase involved in cell wall biosynthesis
MTSTSYPETASDWKGQFIRHLVYALANNDQMKLSIWAPPGELPPSVEYSATDSEKKWLQNLAKQGGIAHVLRKNRFQGMIQAGLLLNKMRHAYLKNFSPDIIHANWLQSVLALPKTRCPVVASVLGTDFALLKLPGMVKAIRSKLRNRKAVITPNAEWMVTDLESHFGDLAGVKAIPFGVDDVWFNIDSTVNFDAPRKWLVVLRITAKKIGPLFEWGETIFRDSDELHLLGPMQENLKIPSWVKYHGATNPSELASQWFPKAFGMITLRHHDEGRPQVLLEAMAAGLPILASNISAHSNLINHAKTGWLVDSRESFLEGIEWLQCDSNRKAVAAQANNYVRTHLGTWHDCANRYIEIYRSLLD